MLYKQIEIVRVKHAFKQSSNNPTLTYHVRVSMVTIGLQKFANCASGDFVDFLKNNIKPLTYTKLIVNKCKAFKKHSKSVLECTNEFSFSSFEEKIKKIFTLFSVRRIEELTPKKS